MSAGAGKIAVSGPEKVVPTLNLTAALYAAVEAVSARHEGLAGVPIVLVVGASKPKVHGHFARETWAQYAADGENVDGAVRAHEILLSGESLSRGATATFGTLVHELAHAFANANGIQDTSNRGRYHNSKFRAIAENFGLSIEVAPTIGHSVTTVPKETEEQYREIIAGIEAALTHYRTSNASEGNRVKKVREKWVLVCPCQEVPISKKFAETAGPLTCAQCHNEMEVTTDG